MPGVEISVTWANQTVHLVGLQIDEANPDLLAGLAKTRSGRDARGREIAAQLEAAGIPAELDLRNEKIGFKVREHSRAKVPQIWVIGEKEADEQLVAIRTLGSQATDTTSLDAAVTALANATRLPI